MTDKKKERDTLRYCEVHITSLEYREREREGGRGGGELEIRGE